MNIEYLPTQLDAKGRFSEVDLSTVEFETLSQCPICKANSEQLQDLAKLEKSLTVSRCGQCGHMFHRRRPTSKWILNWYANGWDKPNGKGLENTVLKTRYLLSGVKARFKGESVFRFVEDAFPDKKQLKILEIGCGYGRQLIPFLLSGHKVRAIEASPRRAKFVRSLGIRVKNTPIENLNEETFGERFDLAYSNHVLEHVSDPHLFIKKLTDVIKPGGWLALFVPNAESSCLMVDFMAAVHLHNFSESSLATLLRMHGFRIHRIQKDYQISVVARYEGKSSEEGLPLADQKATDFSKERLFENLLGSDYRNLQDQEYYCRWRDPSPRMISIHRMEYGKSSDLSAWRELKLKWTGDQELPIHIKKIGKNPEAPFWLK